MIFCPKCGIQIEENSSFCPNCGADLNPQLQLTQTSAPPYTTIKPVAGVKNEGAATGLDQSIKAGVYGFLLAVVINLVSPIYLYFIPSFLAAMLVVYLYRIGTLKDGLIVAFTIYIFNDAFLNTIGLASLFLANEMYTWSVDIWTVLYPTINTITALIATYIGVWLVQKRKSMKTIEV